MTAKKETAPEGVATMPVVEESPAGPPQPGETVTFVSPYGSKMTVSPEHAEIFKDLGYKPSK